MGHIIVLDSGVGGISVLRRLRALLPAARFVYFADDANFPYGCKSREELVALAEKNYLMLTRLFDADAYVVACNTLTAAAIDTLRAAHPCVLIIGCEPPIAPAVRAAENSGVLVLMTEASRASQRLSARFCGANATFLSMSDLAQMIESDAPEADICAYVRTRVEASGAKFGAVALGCTHYSLKKSLFERIFNGVAVFDAAEGVARQTARLLTQNNSVQNGGTAEDVNADINASGGSVLILTSGGKWTAIPPVTSVPTDMERFVRHLENV